MRLCRLPRGAGADLAQLRRFDVRRHAPIRPPCLFARPPLAGARAYLLTQYKWLAAWVLVLFVMVSILLGPAVDQNNSMDGVYTGIALVVGARRCIL